ncbi:MAG: hypothetical protein IT317_08135 [Anaerolineales bacterium]|nr:hypothetical protein [Anaerolineales bacterium]
MTGPIGEQTLLDFGHEFHVVCPRCGGRALVLDRGAQAPAEHRIALTCAACGLAHYWQQAEPGVLTAADPKAYPPGVVAMGAAVDWYYHQPLWLQTPCCGEVLWAYNAAHLDFLEAFIKAKQRGKRPGPQGWRNQALANRLPRWMTSAANRAEVLRGLAALRARLPQPG